MHLTICVVLFSVLRPEKQDSLVIMLKAKMVSALQSVIALLQCQHVKQGGQSSSPCLLISREPSAMQEIFTKVKNFHRLGRIFTFFLEDYRDGWPCNIHTRRLSFVETLQTHKSSFRLIASKCRRITLFEEQF